MNLDILDLLIQPKIGKSAKPVHLALLYLQGVKAVAVLAYPAALCLVECDVHGQISVLAAPCDWSYFGSADWALHFNPIALKSSSNCDTNPAGFGLAFVAKSAMRLSMRLITVRSTSVVGASKCLRQYRSVSRSAA